MLQRIGFNVLLFLFMVSSTCLAQESVIHETDITFETNDGITLGAAVFIPDNAAPSPGIVLVSGAGAIERNAYRNYAEDLARAGIVTLIYDKRPGFTESSPSYEILADDALTALEALSAQPGVDSEKLGLWGHSQGSWVVSLAASKSDLPDFIINVSGSGFTSDKTQFWSNRTLMTHKGISPGLIEPIGINLSRMLVAAGIYGDTATDPAKVLPSVTQPVLALFAEDDPVNPSAESMAVFEAGLSSGGNQNYTIKILSGVNHGLVVSPDGFDMSREPITEEHAEVIQSWLSDLPNPGIHVDSPPAIVIPVQPTEPLSWYESIPLHLTAAGIVLLSALVVAIQTTIHRIKRRPHAPSDKLASLITGFNALAVIGAFFYLGMILFTGAWETGPIVLRRPLIWLVLQMLTLSLIILNVVYVLRWSRHRLNGGSHYTRFLLTEVSSFAFFGLAVYWGLLTI